jgi:hypothetical protein
MPNKDENCFVSITLKRGPKFYGARKHSTHREIGDVLEEYAKKNGTVQELFSLLAKYHYALETEGKKVEPEGDSDSFDFGYCGTCVPKQGGNGQTLSINGVPQPCQACSDK